jgi:hypothetical protein
LYEQKEKNPLKKYLIKKKNIYLQNKKELKMLSVRRRAKLQGPNFVQILIESFQHIFQQIITVHSDVDPE